MFYETLNFGFLRLIFHRVTDIIKHFLKKLFFVRYPYFPIVYYLFLYLIPLSQKVLRMGITTYFSTSFPSPRKSMRMGTTTSAVLGNFTPHLWRACTSNCWYTFIFSENSNSEREDGRERERAKEGVREREGVVNWLTEKRYIDGEYNTEVSKRRGVFTRKILEEKERKGF